MGVVLRTEDRGIQVGRREQFTISRALQVESWARSREFPRHRWRGFAVMLALERSSRSAWREGISYAFSTIARVSEASLERFRRDACPRAELEDNMAGGHLVCLQRDRASFRGIAGEGFAVTLASEPSSRSARHQRISCTAVAPV